MKFLETLNKIANWLLFAAVISLIYFLFIFDTKVVYKKAYEDGYKQACQDFYEGKLKYEPVSTVTWEKK